MFRSGAGAYQAQRNNVAFLAMNFPRDDALEPEQMIWGVIPICDGKAPAIQCGVCGCSTARILATNSAIGICLDRSISRDAFRFPVSSLLTREVRNITGVCRSVGWLRNSDATCPPSLTGMSMSRSIRPG